MKRIYVYFISLILILNNHPLGAQDPLPDSVIIPLSMRAGIEITGPVIYLTDKNILNLEGWVARDVSEKMALFLGAGYSDYRYSQYNYSYLSKGIFFKAGVDFNLLKPEISQGKYSAGAGLHYGITRFISETPSFSFENYWGAASSSISPMTLWAHYLEVSPGFRAELFRNFSIGWSVSIRKMIWSGKGKDLKPIYFPGYGTGGKTFSTAINYFISWNIPYKKIKVPVKIDTPEEPDETEGTEGTEGTPGAQRPGGELNFSR